MRPTPLPRGWHFYALRPFHALAGGGGGGDPLALQYISSSIGAACGMPMGELQGALGNMRTVCGIAAPAVWGRVYALGVARGRPALFYFVAVAVGLVQLGLFHRLTAVADEPGDGPGPREVAASLRK
jgi:hypothetical protein